MDSILTSIKKLLGIAEDYEHFDEDIIIHINSVLMVLSQIGVGPIEGFVIKDKTSKWSDFVDGTSVEAVKTYVYLRVKSIFDPPSAHAVAEAMNSTIRELEYRLNVQYEHNIM